MAGAVVSRAENGPGSSDEQAVQREIARLDSVKPRPSLRPLNNVSFSYHLGLNIRATFKGFGTAANTFAGTNPGPATHGVNHEYDDGYNRVDSAGNDHSAQGAQFANTTTYWGYQNGSQRVSDNQIAMHSAHLSQFADVSNDDPRQGFEIAYERVMHEYEHLYWGIEASFGYSIIDLNQNQTLTAPVITTTDTYDIPFDPVLEEYNVPSAPYQGPFTGSFGSSLLGDIPMRSIAPNGEVATLVAQRHLDANVWRLHLGPKLHIPVNNRLELAFAGGLAVGVVDSHFNYHEQVFSSLLPGGQSAAAHDSSESEGALIGPYFSGLIAMPISPDARIFTGVQWEDLGKYHHSLGSHVAQLDFSSAIAFSLGFSVGF